MKQKSAQSFTDWFVSPDPALPTTGCSRSAKPAASVALQRFVTEQKKMVFMLLGDKPHQSSKLLSTSALPQPHGCWLFHPSRSYWL